MYGYVVEHSCFPHLSFFWGGRRVGGWRLTVNGDPDLGVVVAVGDLPDIKGFRWGVREQTEEQDDGVGRGKTFWMDLPGKRLKIHASAMRRGRGTLGRRRYISAFNIRQQTYRFQALNV